MPLFASALPVELAAAVDHRYMQVGTGVVQSGEAPMYPGEGFLGDVLGRLGRVGEHERETDRPGILQPIEGNEVVGVTLLDRGQVRSHRILPHIPYDAAQLNPVPFRFRPTSQMGARAAHSDARRDRRAPRRPQVTALGELSAQSLPFAKEFRPGTIDRVMEKSDIELGLEYFLPGGSGQD